MRSSAAEELPGSWMQDLGIGDELIQRHSKQFGSGYDDALESIQGGKLGLMNTLLWFVLALPPDEPKARQS